jgi:hypothetical protein
MALRSPILRRPTAARSCALSAFLVAALLAPAFATAQEQKQDPPECREFSWSLAREQAWFAAQDLPTIESGANVASGAFLVKLRPMADVAYAQPPERQPRTPAAYGAAIKLAAPAKPGLYQVTQSDDAWVDVVQGGARLKSAAHTGKKGCPGLRKSLRFEIKAESLIVQISGAATDRLGLALAPVVEH